MSEAPTGSRAEVLKRASRDLAHEVERVKKKHDLSPLEALGVVHFLESSMIDHFLQAEQIVLRGVKSGKPGDL